MLEYMNYRTLPLQRDKLLREARRLQKHGPPPENPFRLLRLGLEVSHANLAKQIYVSEQALIRLEQGTYDRPLPSVVDWWVVNHGVSELQLSDAYAEFQHLTRRRHHDLFGPFPSAFALKVHPFRELRNQADLNPTEVAKALCVPQATIEHFEKKYRTQQSVPRNLLSALNEAGYVSRDLTRLMLAYDLFRAANVRRFTVNEVESNA